MTNTHLTDNRITDNTRPPVQLVKIDQMSQWNPKSGNPTIRTDHWHEGQVNPICIVRKQYNADELETIKGDES